MFNDGRLELSLEQRKELLSDPRAHSFHVAVGSVFPPELFPCAQVCPQFRPPNFQQGPNNGTGHRMNSAKPRETRATEEMCENGLRLIVGSVRNRDPRARA